VILPPVQEIADVLWHITPIRYRDAALFFTKAARNRFDDPRRSYGVLYVSPDVTTAVLESVLHDRTLANDTDRIFTKDFLSQHVVKTIVPTIALRLFDLSAPYALANLGHSNELISLRNYYAQCQAVSEALHENSDVDGILWHSRQAGAVPCCALFEHCAAKLVYVPPDILLLEHRDFPKVVSDLHLTVVT
jgi:hypothetical protein